MPKGFPSLNLDQLRKVASHGAAGGTQGNVMPGANMAPRSYSHGGGAPVANPSRTGMPPLHGTGVSAVPNGTQTAEGARAHTLMLGHIEHAMAGGHLHPSVHAHLRPWRMHPVRTSTPTMPGKEPALPCRAGPVALARWGAVLLITVSRHAPKRVLLNNACKGG
jgi:hypothetical protein